MLSCLGLFTAARVCEQVRTGIQALPHGQAAARRRWRKACRRSTGTCCCHKPTESHRIPPLTSEFLNVFKNSSVASLIGLMELLAQTKQTTAEFSANLFEAFTLATLIYFTLNMSLMLLMRLIEKKVAVPGLMSLGGQIMDFFDFSGIVPALPGLWNGMLMTLKLMVLGVIGGCLGTVLAFDAFVVSKVAGPAWPALT